MNPSLRPPRPPEAKHWRLGAIVGKGLECRVEPGGAKCRKKQGISYSYRYYGHEEKTTGTTAPEKGASVHHLTEALRPVLSQDISVVGLDMVGV